LPRATERGRERCMNRVKGFYFLTVNRGWRSKTKKGMTVKLGDRQGSSVIRGEKDVMLGFSNII